MPYPRFLKSAAFVLGSAVLAGCMGTTSTQEVSRAAPGHVDLPAMKVFADRPAASGKRYSNRDVFEEFLDLTFSLESGHRIERFTRFEEPISVAFQAPPAAQTSQDLNALIRRLRSEAEIDIRRVADGSDANIVIEMLTRRELQRAAPNAACIVVPRVASWAEFRRNRFNRRTDWSSLAARDRAIIFIPADNSAQDIRDCLHEELAQALGPLNDLYRLPDSVFNDDNFHVVLTDYDMMILRAYYSPELRNGMAMHQVAEVLPRVLSRINPQGTTAPIRAAQETRRDWINAIEAALGTRTNASARVSAADRALRLAKSSGYIDHRLGFAYFARARVGAELNRTLAAEDFARAYALFRTHLGARDIHTAQAGLQMASIALSAGRALDAEKFAADAVYAGRSSQNARLLFSALLIQAEARDIQGDTAQAAAMRQEAMAWGRYSIDSASEMRQRMAVIAGLNPARRMAARDN